MSSKEWSELLSAAQRRYDIRALPTLNDVYDFLEALGALPLTEGTRDDLIAGDEFVDPKWVVAAFTMTDNEIDLAARATPEETENFVDDPDDTFDPMEFGPDEKAWTVFQHELSTLRRICVVLERDPIDAERLFQFRVYGAGQWLREVMWAATGILPRDLGDPHSALFHRAIRLSGR